MPAYLRGLDNSLLRFVQLNPTKPLHYGWKTKDFSTLGGITGDEMANVLGHLTAVQMGLIAGAIAVIGANSPKPARVRKILNRRPTAVQQGSVTTFVSGESAADWELLLESGWEIVNGEKRITISDNQRFQTVGANCSNGAIYCFPLSKTVPQIVIDELGLIPAAELRLGTTLGKCVSQASKPRPPKVKKIGIETAAGSYDAHTFCSVDAYEAALQNGWLPAGGEIPYFSNPANP